MNSYLKNSHFEKLAPSNSSLTRLSSKAMHFDSKQERGIIYVNTIVVTVYKHSKQIVLNSDGRQTATTKKWMRQVLDKYNFDLYQKQGQRYIDDPHNDKLHDYKDNIILHYK